MTQKNWDEIENLTKEDFIKMCSVIEYTLQKDFNWGSDSPVIGIRGDSNCKCLIYRTCMYDEHTLEYYEDDNTDYLSLLNWLIHDIIWTYEDGKAFLKYLRKGGEVE